MDQNAPPAGPAYRALALQTRTEAVNGLSPAAAREAMAASIARIGAEVAAAKRWVGPDLRLVVLPEYVLSGFPMGEPIERWRDMAALAPDGPEDEALSGLDGAAPERAWFDRRQRESIARLTDDS
ncbi:hypothetical protein Acsp03_40050 [Actinomadura sp. NBRC 104412]|uniref:hypothetical protein n=1 Tax=Actinomadura sp. NBRC 104412 TaxID=3032203 RepID=UPI0024A3147B|nr:hypothetical protein [Actinomadura sp. NBRC 104412]GLZ06539.1 hypothetical protein Acsp03_40050 [Actinomadura sp. NBRC 104412]